MMRGDPSREGGAHLHQLTTSCRWSPSTTFPAGRAGGELTGRQQTQSRSVHPQGPGEYLLVVQVSLTLEQHGLQKTKTSAEDQDLRRTSL